ncbi:osteocrin isoform X2 [Scyliorhinus torazame]|uniref:osteocrin isoform X2 n=1 Tax=Scyliorhinus torazame TaxID=75743 RepID=UPI003B5B27A0
MEMLGSGQNFLHLLLVLSIVGSSGGTSPGTQAAELPSDPSPWAKAVLTSASMEGNDSSPSAWLPPFSHLTSRQTDVASKKKRRSVPQLGFRSNRSSAKPKSGTSKPGKVPDGRRRRVNFPMDRIGHMYLPKIRN